MSKGSDGLDLPDRRWPSSPIGYGPGRSPTNSEFGRAWGARAIASNTLLRFPAGGLQTKRRTREDGVAIGQIVPSAVKCKAMRPDAVKDDTTKLQITAQWGS